jgi:hypothetical protein
MKFKCAIIGSGISSLIYFKNTKKKIKVFTDTDRKIIQNNNLYEYSGIGGNSNIWGGYINFNKHNKFLKNLNYKNFFRNNLLKVHSIFIKSKYYNSTYCLTDYNNKIFRVSKKFFDEGRALIEKRINKIELQKGHIKLITNNKIYFVNNLVLCVGNLGLINLLTNSNLIRPMDKITFEDGNVSYGFTFLSDTKKNYNIPMPIKYIIEKLIFKKSKNYNLTNKTTFVQKFSKNYTTYSFLCKHLLKIRKNKIRFFLSNHITNLKVNNLPIREYISKKSNRIKVYNTGTIRKYKAGPIIQDLIFDIVNKC